MQVGKAIEGKGNNEQVGSSRLGLIGFVLPASAKEVIFIIAC